MLEEGISFLSLPVSAARYISIAPAIGMSNYQARFGTIPLGWWMFSAQTLVLACVGLVRALEHLQ